MRVPHVGAFAHLSPNPGRLATRIREVRGSIHFADRRKRMNAAPGPRWTAYVTVFGRDVEGVGETQESALLDAVETLPEWLSAHLVEALRENPHQVRENQHPVRQNPYVSPWPREEFRVVHRPDGWVVLQATHRPEQTPWVRRRGIAYATADVAEDRATNMGLNASYFDPLNPHPVLVFDRAGRCLDAFLRGYSTPCPAGLGGPSWSITRAAAARGI